MNPWWRRLLPGHNQAVTVRAAERSHIGLVRTANEDATLSREDLGLFLVCDGMGGHGGGERASRLATATVEKEIGCGRTLQEAVLAAHAAVAELEADPGALRPGSTIVALHLAGGGYQLAWVGDSRAWLIEGGKIRQLTVDHTVTEQMVAWGDLRPEEALHHPDRHRLTQALGVGGEGGGGYVPGTVAAGASFSAGLGWPGPLG
jgi:protein phosphatase